MKRAYRVYNKKSGKVLLSFVATSDKETIERAKEMYNMEENRLEKWNGLQAPIQFTKII